MSVSTTVIQLQGVQTPSSLRSLLNHMGQVAIRPKDLVRSQYHSTANISTASINTASYPCVFVFKKYINETLDILPMDHLAHATVENNHERWFKNLNLSEYPRHSKIFVEGIRQRRKEVKKELEELRNYKSWYILRNNVLVIKKSHLWIKNFLKLLLFQNLHFRVD